jgi:hypothetical protein
VSARRISVIADDEASPFETMAGRVLTAECTLPRSSCSCAKASQ